ncbi:unnamed protein product [Triticum turgidum subsp. durum]|uniref:Exopolygalacturonase n=1 Tax=Triticum turgidum subsp. durum TaxID=4567 RepID=A0A9R1RCX5_TRITD|nr:unnamed protein product [Triticum turgidum subsp. durum]
MEPRPRPLAVAVNALLCVLSLCVSAAEAENVTTYDAKNFGAKGNGVDDDTKALVAAWKKACGTPGTVTLVIPPGTYYIGPAHFHGPCEALAITFLLQGVLMAATDLKRFGNDWIEFGWVTNLTVVGQNGGVIDGQGAASWPFNKCPVRKDCKVLPTSVMFLNNQNTVVRDITSVNSKFFHIALLHNNNMRMSNLRIHAPENSPNTDGIHIERNTGVIISDSRIGTGDDCISIGQGNHNIYIARVHYGPGHGMSVGSLGRYVGEGDVTSIHVTDMTFQGTMNGVRIKTWENSPTKSLAARMLFENMVMKDVQTPIIIDQKYCPYYNCEQGTSPPLRGHPRGHQVQEHQGHVDVARGRAAPCGVPCHGVVLQNADLIYNGQTCTLSHCENANATYVGY